MNHKFIISNCIVIILLALQFSCTRNQRFAVDYSTPENAWNTKRQALVHKNADVYLESLSENFRRLHGTDRAAQLKSIKEMMKQSKANNKSTFQITKIEQGDSNEYDVKLYIDQFVGGKLYSKGTALMVKENGEWKSTVDKKNIPLPEGHPELIKRRRDANAKYMLHEETGLIIRIDDIPDDKK